MSTRNKRTNRKRMCKGGVTERTATTRRSTTKGYRATGPTRGYSASSIHNAVAKHQLRKHFKSFEITYNLPWSSNSEQIIPINSRRKYLEFIDMCEGDFNRHYSLTTVPIATDRRGRLEGEKEILDRIASLIDLQRSYTKRPSKYTIYKMYTYFRKSIDELYRGTNSDILLSRRKYVENVLEEEQSALYTSRHEFRTTLDKSVVPVKVRVPLSREQQQKAERSRIHELNQEYANNHKKVGIFKLNPDKL